MHPNNIQATNSIAKHVPMFYTNHIGVTLIPNEDYSLFKYKNIHKLKQSCFKEPKSKFTIDYIQKTQRRSVHFMHYSLLAKLRSYQQKQTSYSCMTTPIKPKITCKLFCKAFDSYKSYETLFSYFGVKEVLLFTHLLKAKLHLSQSQLFIARRRLEQLVFDTHGITNNERNVLWKNLSRKKIVNEHKTAHYLNPKCKSADLLNE